MLGFSVVQWILAGVVTASVVGGGWAIANHFEDKGAARVTAEYAPLASVCDAFPGKGFFGGAKKSSPAECAPQVKARLALGEQAIEANKSLADSFDRLDKQRRECSDRVAVMASNGAKADEAARKRKADDAARLAALTPEKLEMIDALGLPEPPGTCEAKLARRDALWAKVAAQRARDFPGTPPAKDADAVTIKAPAK